MWCEPMSDVCVRVEELGKRYRIGSVRRANTLRDAIATAVRGSVRRNPRGREDRQTIWALRNVSFDVREGEVLGVIGRNGAGKSTLLKILSRVTEPTEGRVVVHGRLGSLLEVGTGFHPELTGRENVYLNGVILGMKRKVIQKKFDDIVAFSGVGQFIDTPVKRYSSGMYARLAFAVASSVEPDVLLVDEVLSVGDAEFQNRCYERMHGLSAAGRTVLFISHSMPAVKALCTRAILLDGGRVAGEGAVDEVIASYLQAGARPTADGFIPADAARIGTGTIRLRRVVVEDTGGQPLAQLFLNQPFCVVLTLEVLEDTEDAILEVGISTTDGTRVTTSFSTDGERPAERLGRGWYEVRLDLAPGLLPRAYVVDAGVHHLGQGHLTIDFVERVLGLTVLNESETGHDRHIPTPTRGLVRPVGHWLLPRPVSIPGGGAKP